MQKTQEQTGSRVITPGGKLASVRSVYAAGTLTTVVHDDPEENGIDGYMIYWTKDLGWIDEGEG